MGQRSATETLFGIIAAFIEQRTWTQAALARRLETTPETIRKRLTELVAGGFKLERSEDHPHVYWSAPKDWFPGALAFKPNEVGELMRLLSRAPRGQLRDEVLGVVVERLANLGHAGRAAIDPEAVRPPEVRPEEEKWLTLIEDAARKKLTLKIRYFTASRRDETWRHVSVHRIDLGTRTHFIATCHKAGALRRFRLSGVSDARTDGNEPYRKTTKETLAKFDRESFGNFHSEGPVVKCAFLVRESEAAWVKGNLPEGTIAQERRDDGVLFRVETTAVGALARFVVGLGAAAKAETPELADEVRALARGALANLG